MPNAKNIEQVKNLTEKLENAKAIYVTDYLGLDVASITELRKQFFAASVEYTVAKNTLVKLASKKAEINDLDTFLDGPTAWQSVMIVPRSRPGLLKSLTKIMTNPLFGVFILTAKFLTDRNSNELLIFHPKKNYYRNCYWFYRAR